MVGVGLFVVRECRLWVRCRGDTPGGFGGGGWCGRWGLVRAVGVGAGGGGWCGRWGLVRAVGVGAGGGGWVRAVGVVGVRASPQPTGLQELDQRNDHGTRGDYRPNQHPGHPFDHLVFGLSDLAFNPGDVGL